MPIDTSSYYPEVPSPDGKTDDNFSLNKREGSLFGDDRKQSPEPSDQEPAADLSPEPTPSVPNKNNKNKDDDETPVERTITGASHILSWILVPLLMPVYGLILAFGLSILDVAPMGMRVVFTLIVAGINVVVPMILIVLLKKMGIVDDLGLNGQKERLIPYVISIVGFLVTAWFMYSKGAPQWLSLFFAGGGIAAFVNLIINLKWKISAHAAGIAGVVALLIRIAKDGSPEPDIFFWLMLTIALAGLLGSARVWLGRHTVWQVLAGYAVGFCSVFFLTMIK